MFMKSDIDDHYAFDDNLSCTSEFSDIPTDSSVTTQGEYRVAYDYWSALLIEDLYLNAMAQRQSDAIAQLFSEIESKHFRDTSVSNSDRIIRSDEGISNLPPEEGINEGHASPGSGDSAQQLISEIESMHFRDTSVSNSDRIIRSDEGISNLPSEEGINEGHASPGSGELFDPVNYYVKPRKQFCDTSVSNSDRLISSNEGISNLPEKGINEGHASPGSGATMRGASGSSSSAAVKSTSFQSQDIHMKLRIKSFRMPEFSVEIPETVTVDSLKRTIIKEATAILGSELHVGVLLQGKKVKDDSETLLQIGISHDSRLDVYLGA